MTTTKTTSSTGTSSYTPSPLISTAEHSFCRGGSSETLYRTRALIFSSIGIRGLSFALQRTIGERYSRSAHKTPFVRHFSSTCLCVLWPSCCVPFCAWQASDDNVEKANFRTDDVNVTKKRIMISIEERAAESGAYGNAEVAAAKKKNVRTAAEKSQRTNSGAWRHHQFAASHQRT